MAWHQVHRGEFQRRDSATARAKEIRKAGYKAKVVKVAAKPMKKQPIRYVVNYWT